MTIDAMNAIAAKAIDKSLYYSVTRLRARGWTRSQINALPPDLVVNQDRPGKRGLRRFWLRSRMEELEQEVEWTLNRAKTDSRVQRNGGRDLATTRKGTRAEEKSKPKLAGPEQEEQT
jgi:hypothetical protein